MSCLCVDAPGARDAAQQLLSAVCKAPTSKQQSTEAFCPSPSPLQDCLKACQEQIEAALAESLKQASQSHQELGTKTAAYPASQPTSTPTDVTDVNL